MYSYMYAFFQPEIFVGIIILMPVNCLSQMIDKQDNKDFLNLVSNLNKYDKKPLCRMSKNRRFFLFRCEYIGSIGEKNEQFFFLGVQKIDTIWIISSEWGNIVQFSYINGPLCRD